MEVQGATNVAKLAISALSEQLRITPITEKEVILKLIEEAKTVLFEARITEPFMRNSIRYIDWKISHIEWSTKDEFWEIVLSVRDEVLGIIEDARKTIVEVGSKRILPGITVFTHCHSSAVSAIFLEAFRQGIEFRVICTETRPRYQGRITALELLKEGIETTMIVDSASRSFMKEVDLVLIGADAITSEGNIINKIGSSNIALVANEARVPFYVASELLKFVHMTIYGEYETIEERSSNEVWPDSPAGLSIRNPAFDVTRRDFIHGIISEEGVISPHSILEAVHRRYPWILAY